MTENPSDRVSQEPTEVPAGALAAGETMRIDTWLWATRHVKSRSQATSAARAGHVKINGESVKAAQKVRVGDEVRLRVEGFDRVLIVSQAPCETTGLPLCEIVLRGSQRAEASAGGRLRPARTRQWASDEERASGYGEIPWNKFRFFRGFSMVIGRVVDS